MKFLVSEYSIFVENPLGNTMDLLYIRQLNVSCKQHYRKFLKWCRMVFSNRNRSNLSAVKKMSKKLYLLVI